MACTTMGVTKVVRCGQSARGSAGLSRGPQFGTQVPRGTLPAWLWRSPETLPAAGCSLSPDPTHVSLPFCPLRGNQEGSGLSRNPEAKRADLGGCTCAGRTGQCGSGGSGALGAARGAVQ